MASPGYSTLFQALALHRLGDRTAAGGAVEALRVHLEELGRAPVRIDYFATSLPNLLLFDEDMERRRRADCTWLRALIALGEGDAEGGIVRLGGAARESESSAGAGYALTSAEGGQLSRDGGAVVMGAPTQDGESGLSAEAAPLRAWLAGFAGALGGLLFGYDWVVIGGAKSFYEAYFHIRTPGMEAWAMSCALVGCLAGTLASGRLSARRGRRWMLMGAAMLFVVSSLGTASSGSLRMFVLWRIAGGCAIGAASDVAPMFLAEIAPTALRARFVSMNQMAIVFGVLAAQGMNWLIARPAPAGMTAAAVLASWNVQWGWRWMFGITAVPSAVFFVAALVMPESPRWLLANSREFEALDAFRRLGVSGAEAAAIREGMEHNNDIPAECPAEGEGQSFASLLWRKEVLRILAMGICLAVLQQWCGINVIFAYAQDIFARAGFSVSQGLFQIVLTGVANLLFTVLALYFVDRVGRRVLLLSGLFTLAGIYLLLGWMTRSAGHGAAVAALCLVAIAAYAMTLAPVSWVVIAEIYPSRLRAEAMSITVGALWVASFTLTSSFPLIRAHMGMAEAFWLYALVCCCGGVALALWLPETRGYSLETLEERLYGKG